MHILLVHQAFAALDEAGGTRHHELARFLVKAGTLDHADIPPAWLAPDAAQQQALRVTHAVTATGTDFRFAQPWKSLQNLPKAGTIIGWDGDTAVNTPHDYCVLIMPSVLNVRAGVTVVRLAQPIA